MLNIDIPTKAQLIDGGAYTSLLLVILKIVWHETQSLRVWIAAMWETIPSAVVKAILGVVLGIYIGVATYGWLAAPRAEELPETIESTGHDYMRKEQQVEPANTQRPLLHLGLLHSKKKQT
jgi:hypothetical protein